VKYERNQYSEGFSICALIIAGAFLYWGLAHLSLGMHGHGGDSYQQVLE